MNCNHVVAIDYEGYEGGGLVYVHDRDEQATFRNTYDPNDPPDEITWFNFCPMCGERLTPPSTGGERL